MPDQLALDLGDQRNTQRTSCPQRIDNELLSVAAVRMILKSPFSYFSYGRYIRRRLFTNDHHAGKSFFIIQMNRTAILSNLPAVYHIETSLRMPKTPQILTGQEPNNLLAISLGLCYYYGL